jgi:NIMA (never in mitosis gene a)-related kinase 2
MEYCAGIDLGPVIQKCRDTDRFIHEDEIWNLFIHIVVELFECNRRKDKKMKLHCDLKPSNIFLDQNRNAKLADFGFAKAINPSISNADKSVYMQTYLGTPLHESRTAQRIE